MKNSKASDHYGICTLILGTLLIFFFGCGRNMKNEGEPKVSEEVKNSVQPMYPSLLFVGDQAGNAEEAVKYYVSLFKESQIFVMKHYGPDGPDKEGFVQRAEFTIKGQKVVALDSFLKHDFTFTPAVSLCIECDSQEEIETLYKSLPEGGKILMPLGKYGFGKSFAWVDDKYGVSWQLLLK